MTKRNATWLVIIGGYIFVGLSFSLTSLAADIPLGERMATIAYVTILWPILFFGHALFA